MLWIEESPGHSQAIPAEYVLAIIEVKSRYTTSNVTKALEHLSELQPLMKGIDAPFERYKQYLPATFCCGIVFFEVYESDAYSKTGLNRIAANHAIRGFFGGIILRGEGHNKPLTGRISLGVGQTSIKSFNGKGKVSLLKTGTSDSIRVTDNRHISAFLMWAEMNFAGFAFDILAMLRGIYEPGRASSFHGIGSSDME